mgnify:CR=1 FL=1
MVSSHQKLQYLRVSESLVTFSCLDRTDFQNISSIVCRNILKVLLLRSKFLPKKGDTLIKIKLNDENNNLVVSYHVSIGYKDGGASLNVANRNVLKKYGLKHLRNIIQ